MNQETFDKLKQYSGAKEDYEEKLMRINCSIFKIVMECDHTYPDGTSAIQQFLWTRECKICSRIVPKEE